MDNPMFNSSHAYDPTAYKAIRNVETRQANRVIRIFRLIAELAGFEIVGRIKLKNRRNGVIHK